MYSLLQCPREDLHVQFICVGSLGLALTDAGGQNGQPKALLLYVSCFYGPECYMKMETVTSGTVFSFGGTAADNSLYTHILQSVKMSNIHYLCHKNSLVHNPPAHMRVSVGMRVAHWSLMVECSTLVTCGTGVAH